MAASCEKLDQLVKDYLLFRGFSNTLKTLDQELKTDKDKGLRVDRMMEQMWTLLSGYDLQGLREYWKYLNQRLFSRLEQRYSPSVRRLESSLLKLYIVNAHQSGRQDKVLGFFEQLGAELQSHPDLKDWFAFPFVTNPADNPVYSLYFSKQWQDTLQLSLHNFLSVVLQAMPVPTLLNVEFDARRMKTLQEENTSLKQQLMNTSMPTAEQVRESRSGTKKTLHAEFQPPASSPDMVYDFSGLANESETSNPEKQKSTRRFPLSLTSPLVGRKKSEPSQSKTKAVTSSSATASTSGSTTTAAVAGSGTQGKQQGKVTEMAVFPPPGMPRTQSDAKRSSVTSTSPASSAATTTTAASKVPSNAKQSAPPLPPRRTSQQSQQAVKQTSSATTETASTAALGGPAPPLPSRSFSTPEPKAGAASKSKPVMAKRGSENQLSQARDSTSGSPASGSGHMSTSADTESEAALANTSADSPFLLLEDEYSEHSSAASFCRFSLTGQYVASLDVDGIVKVWTWSPQPATTATVMSRSAFLSLAWASKSDRWLLLGNKTGTIRLFDVKESKTYREVLVNSDSPANCMRVTDLSTSPSSMQYVCATSDLCPFTSDLSKVSGRLLQWDLRTLKLEKNLQVDSDVCNAVTCSAYNQSGHMLVTGGADGCVRVYDANQQKAILKWQGHDTPIHTVQFHGDKAVYSMSADGKLCEWSLARTGHLLNSLSPGPRDIGTVNSGSCRGRLFALDLDQNYLLTYNEKRGIIYQVTGVSSPTNVMDLKSHQSSVVTVDWSPSVDTRVCLTSSDDGKIKISTLLSK